jgi:disulfide bond formation protein DsbB
MIGRYAPVMKTRSKSRSMFGPALLALFAVGGLAALALPLPASVVGLALVLLGLCVGVMVAAMEERGAQARPIAPDAREPALRAANG